MPPSYISIVKGAAKPQSAAGATTFETNRRAEDGHTALTLAARGLHGGVVAALFAAGADGRLRLPGTRESFLHVGMRAANAAYKKSEAMMDVAKAFAVTLRAFAFAFARSCFTPSSLLFHLSFEPCSRPTLTPLLPSCPPLPSFCTSILPFLQWSSHRVSR